MGLYRYRAATSGGSVREGTIEADSTGHAVAQLQGQGLRPISYAQVAAGTGDGAAKRSRVKPDQVAKAMSELAVLVAAGLSLDRSLTIVLDNIEAAPLKAQFADLHRQVKEGVPLSDAIAAAGAAFHPMAAPMIGAGEANGKLGQALAKLAETLERTQKLRQELVSAMIYPAILIVIASSVIILMLLFVVPQFEGLFANAQDKLPAMTKLVLAASRGFRDYGLVMLGVAIGLGVLARAWLRQPGVRAMMDRRILSVPHLGELVRRIEIGRFARVLGNLAGGGVPLPNALVLAQRTIGNRVIANAVASIADRVKEGGLLSQLAAEAGVFPRLALSFIRTGEETAQLDKMLDRLADVLDEEVALRLQRLVGIMTPLITIIMGITIATVIGSIMTAILGFNDLALE